ncbi:MAG TPA: sigma-70 family RNA polymerase sigma factor, partial [Anaerolineae bacterium]|nr:sigma-70 family RNA polymerase sigma factor [Anaerolineae bacterium]
EVRYGRHAQVIFNLIMRIVQDRGAADDLLQETFWQVWQAGNQSQFRGEGAAAAWLFRIARNKSLDYLRRQKARPQAAEATSPEEEQPVWDQLVTPGAEIEQITERQWQQQSVRQALQNIPAEQRRCLELAYFEGMSQRQIAAQTNTSLGTIKTRLRLGLEKLEQILRSAGYSTEHL